MIPALILLGAVGLAPADAPAREPLALTAAPAVDDAAALHARLAELKSERDALAARADDLQRQLENAQQELTATRKSIADVTARLSALDREKGQLAAALAEAREQARDLQTKLGAEQVKSATLREDKQKLMSGTTTAKEEIARLQKRASELESEQARAEDLAKRLTERDQEIERLRKAAAEREALASKVASLTDKLERAKQRVTALTDELAGRGRGEASSTIEGRPQLESAKPDDTPRPDKHRIESAKSAAGLGDDKRARDDDPDRKAQREAAGRQDRELVLRLAATQAELARSFEPDVAKGDILLQQDRGRLTISMSDRLLFDNGQRAIRTDGRKTLRRLGEIFKAVPDKLVRVESRMDDGAGGKREPAVGRDLHTARAATVARVLVEEGGLDAADLTTGLAADSRNGSGPPPDHHIEIILAPKQP